MKILKLKSNNINSLKGEFSIDFTSFLDNNALFAITGPTGAGKSTILDIITCALYGRTPRLKNPNELMSRHTGECLCEVEFEIRGQIFRSSWTQKRARKSADGKFQTAKMELSDVETSKVLKATLRDVPKYVEELSGLDFDRFIQSMMLAQGSFDAFLKAKESDRSTLLEKITGTQIYAKISKEIYDTYSTLKTDIESDKKILDSTELLDFTEVDEKSKLLSENTKEKESLVKKETELILIQTWIETLVNLENDSIKYAELFSSISKDKENKKEDFLKLSLANKALNVQSTYEKKNTLVSTIQKEELSLSALTLELKTFNAQYTQKQLQYEAVKEQTLQTKKEFDENSTKIKEIRTLNTQISEKENILHLEQQSIRSKSDVKLKYQKNLEDIKVDFLTVQKKIDDAKNYINKNAKDEKILESLSSIQKDIKEYENEKKISFKILDEKRVLDSELVNKNTTHVILENEVISLENIYKTKNMEYKKLEESASSDTLNEPILRQKFTLLQGLLKDFTEYENLLVNIEKENQSKLSLSNEIINLNKNIADKNTLLNELKTHIVTLREKKDAELLIVKYDDDRSKINEGDECYLCGSTTHPYIKNEKKIDLNSTNLLIQEKESAYFKSEEEYKALDTKRTQTHSKYESHTLELIKLEEQLNLKKEIFKKESLLLNDETKLNLEEQIRLCEINLNQIISRREDKEKLLKDKEKAQENYSVKQNLMLQSNVERNKIITNQEQNTKEEKSNNQKLKELELQMSSEFKKFDMIFDEINYGTLLENLIQRNKLFVENQTDLKEQEQKKNSYDLTHTENTTKLNALCNELVNHEENRVELESVIANLKEASLEILNVADINMYERQIKSSFEKIQKIENDSREDVSSLLTKIQEYQKQEKSFKDGIILNKNTLDELTTTLDNELKNNHFKDIDSLQNALLPKEEREELTVKCKAIEDEYTKYETLKTDTSMKLQEHKKEILTTQSLDEIKTELSLVKKKSDELQLSIGELSAILKRNEQDRLKNQEKIMILEKKKAEFEVWIKLNEMVGSADGNKFAKFAQGITLDQLINLANQHLIVLSSRYELQRSSDPKQLLEIEVCDSFQGNVIRPVSTLSGGESFIVSLSLALGLSELASQKIAIDSLFLDEGFGTLDEDSLETALNALNLLQSRGKMVGVISHVEALKERIPLQIKIIPKGDGTSFIEMN